MELWIRSQDKRHLIKANYVSIMENNIINVASSGWDYDVAKYKTKERALEVLDEIQKYIADSFSQSEALQFFGSKPKSKVVYQMPNE